VDSAISDTSVSYLAPTIVESAKILITGPFAVGKTTMVAALSEITPLRTEEALSQAGEAVDDLCWTPEKSTTTVAYDFGRLTLGPTLVLYLFGTPGQDRFSALWDSLAYGALGAVVLADTRRISDSFPMLDRLDGLGLPYAVAANTFDGAPRHHPDELRQSLALPPDTPLVECDARDRRSAASAVIALVEHLPLLRQERP